MSSQVWAIEMLQKHQLAVDFWDGTIEAPNGFHVTFGVGGEYQTFYGALQYMIGRLTK